MILEILYFGLVGALLLVSYAYFLQNTKNYTVLWGSIRGNLLSVYKISLFIVALCFLLIFAYLIHSRMIEKREFIMPLTAFLLFSMCWMPLSLAYHSSPSTFVCIADIMVLFLVSMSALVLSYRLYKTKNKSVFSNVATLSALYIFLHCFLLDTCIWSYNFF